MSTVRKVITTETITEVPEAELIKALGLPFVRVQRIERLFRQEQVFVKITQATVAEKTGGVL